MAHRLPAAQSTHPSLGRYHFQPPFSNLAPLLPPLAGTSAATSMSLLLEPGFVSQGAGDQGQSPPRPPLYFALPNCSALSEDDAATLGRIGEVRGMKWGRGWREWVFGGRRSALLVVRQQAGRQACRQAGEGRPCSVGSSFIRGMLFEPAHCCAPHNLPSPACSPSQT